MKPQEVKESIVVIVDDLKSIENIVIVEQISQHLEAAVYFLNQSAKAINEPFDDLDLDLSAAFVTDKTIGDFVTETSEVINKAIETIGVLSQYQLGGPNYQFLITQALSCLHFARLEVCLWNKSVAESLDTTFDELIEFGPEIDFEEELEMPQKKAIHPDGEPLKSDDELKKLGKTKKEILAYKIHFYKGEPVDYDNTSVKEMEAIISEFELQSSN